MSRIEEIVAQMCDFIAYVGDFYGQGGIYDMGASVMQIVDAVGIYAARVGYENLCLDSVDREGVRDVLIEMGLVFPEAPIRIVA